VSRNPSSSDVFGARGRVGAAGERLFVSTGLRNAGLDQFPTWTGLDIPTTPGSVPLRGDVDCVIANGDKVVLVDVKRWAKAVYWTVPGTRIGMKGLVPMSDGGRVGLSSNMGAALDRYRAALGGSHVSALVVFVPTTNHDPASVPTSVRWLTWPGGIRSYLAGEAYAELHQRLGPSVEPVPDRTRTLLERLVRR
jgi:hypothetical protein